MLVIPDHVWQRIGMNVKRVFVCHFSANKEMVWLGGEGGGGVLDSVNILD